MKRNLLGMMAFLFSVTMSFGQTVLLSEDFEDGTLGDFTTIDVDMAPAHVNVAEFGGGFVVAEINDNLGLSAIANSWFTPVQAADNWLISPAVEIINGGTILTWDASAVDASYPDGYAVKISTTGNSPADFTDELFRIEAETVTGSYTTRGVNLDDYVGQTIYFAFHHTSDNQLLLRIDNISVAELRAYDLAVSEDPSVYRFADAGGNSPISVTVTNVGSELTTSLDASYTINGNTVTETFDGLNIGALESTVITFTEAFALDNADVNTVAVTVTNPNGQMDEVMDNNNYTAEIIGVMDGPEKQIFVEEATGTWCTWCPRGAVFMDLMEQQFGDNFAGVAVHVGNQGHPDPMEVLGYGGSFAGLVNGFPTLVIDRGENPGIPNLSEMNSFGQDLVDFTTSRPSPVGAEISAEINPSTREMNITVTGSTHSNMTGTNFNVSVLITEDHVMGDAFAYRQINAYANGANGNMGGWELLSNPASGADIEFNHTLRASLTGFDGAFGLFPADIVAGETYTAEYTYTVPADHDMEEQNVVVVMYDMNGGGIAYNANTLRKVPLLVSGVADLLDENVVRVFPNPVTNDLTNIKLSLEEAQPVSVQILNTVGSTIAAKNYGTLSGTQVLPFYTDNVPAGIYYIHVKVGDKISTEKVSVIK